MELGTMLLIVVVPFCLFAALLIGAWKSGPRTKSRTTVYVAYLLGAVFIAGGLLYYATVQTVAADEKSDRWGARWGYKVERYRFRDRFRLSIWHIWGSETRFSYEGGAYWKTPDVIEQRWLSGDRAIYLNLGLGLENSVPQFRTPAKIIFDFDRGQLYLFSNDWLWRRYPEHYNSRERWMTEQEFSEVLSNLELK
jgi:hypothetical protein